MPGVLVFRLGSGLSYGIEPIAQLEETCPTLLKQKRHRPQCWAWDSAAVLHEPFNMKLDRRVDSLFDQLARSAGRDAARQIGDIRGPVALSPFVNDVVLFQVFSQPTSRTGSWKIGVPIGLATIFSHDAQPFLHQRVIGRIHAGVFGEWMFLNGHFQRHDGHARFHSGFERVA